MLIAFEDLSIVEEIKLLFPNAGLNLITKGDITGKSIREIISLTNRMKYELAIISNRNSQVNRTDTSLKLLAYFTNSYRQIILFDESRKTVYSKFELLLELIPRLTTGLFFGILVYLKAQIYFALKSFWWKRKIVDNEIIGNKIAFLRTDLSGKVTAGGSLTHIKGFTRGARELGFDVEFFSDYPVISEPITILIRPNPIFDFFDEFQLIDYHFRFYRNTKKIFKKYNPSLIYQRHSIFNASGIALSKYFNIPIILEVNNSEVWGKKNWSRLVFEKLANKIERTAFENANVISAVSEVTRDQIIPLGANPEKIVVNPNGVDTKIFSPIIEGSLVKEKYNLKDEIIVGFIGTFTKWHGVEVLFEAIQKVLSKEKEIVFILIGDGNLKSNLETRTKELNLNRNVIFTGIIPYSEAPKYLAACDILVSPHLGFESPQRFFGSPTKLFEYMAMGKAIIASDLEQIGKIIHHGVNGMKVKPGDADELADSIIQLINNPTLRSTLGRNARKDAEENFTWKMNAEKVLSRLTQNT